MSPPAASDDTAAAADASRLARPARTRVSDRIIVKFRSNATASMRRSARASASAGLLRSLPATGAEVLRVARGADARAAANRLARNPNVLYATPDVFRRAATSDPWYTKQWGLSNTGQTIGGSTGVSGIDSRAVPAWGRQLGAASTIVAVTDTGIDIDHPDLAGAIWTNPGEAGALATNGVDDDGNGYVDDVHGWDFANDDASVFDVGDGDEHGTHVAGTIAAAGNNDTGGAGVAYGVKILPLKFLGPTGGWDSDAIDAISYAKARGVKIINASWGAVHGDDGYADSAALKDAIASCDCMFVAAAGNNGGNNDVRNGANYPASFDLPNIVSVAAMTNTGALASFSSYGATTVDVAAPGVGILSTVPRQRRGTAAVHVSTGTYQAQHWGFGLEDIATAAKRADLLGRALQSLGTAVGDPILLVADDEADTVAAQSGFYSTALTTLGYTNVTTTSVATGVDGPSAAAMAGKTVIWETGLAYGANTATGPLRSNDLTNLTSFLDGGGKLLLAGADAIYRSETTTFVRERLQLTFLREEAVQTTLSGLAAPYVGQSYVASSADSAWGLQAGRANPYRDVVDLRGANAVAVLGYPGEAGYDSSYAYYQGTSMAAPHVAGVAALVQSRWPTISGAAIADRVKGTARVASGLTGKVATGGFVDAEQAVGDVPSPPATVSARVVNGNLWVSWTASPAPFNQLASTGYEVQLVKNGSPVGGWSAFAAPGEYALRDVPGGGAYAVRVRAVGASGVAAPRQSATTVTMAAGGAPAQVTGLTVTYTSAAPVLSWPAPVSNGSGILAYEICQTGGSCRTLTGTLGSAPASSLAWDTPPGEVSVRAVNSYGTGAASAAVTVQAYSLPGQPLNVTAVAGDESTVVPRDVTAPAAVTGLTIVPGPERAALSWANPGDGDLAGVSVRLVEGSVAPGPGEGVEVFRGAGTTATATGLLSGRTYSFAVYAYDDGVNYSSAAVASLRGSRLTHAVSKRRVTYGGAVTHRVTLTRAGTTTALAAKPVQLVHRRPGTSTWSRVCSLTTSSKGQASCVTKPRGHTQYRWQFAGTRAQAGAVTSAYAVRVHAKVSAALRDSTVRRGTSVRISGSVAPRHAKQKVYLQRYYRGAWRTVTSAYLSSTSTYSFSVRPRARATLAYRVHKKADADHAYGNSPTRRIYGS